MANELLAMAAMIAVVAASLCTHGAASLRVGAEAPQAIHEACEVADHRCSRCHSADRIVEVRATEPVELETLVRRMRQKPESDISALDQDAIARCLVYRQFGQAGLERLEPTTAGGGP
jgi:hypothetical protein